jgi:hypothetical protein
VSAGLSPVVASDSALPPILAPIRRKRHSLLWRLRIRLACWRASRDPAFGQVELDRLEAELEGTWPGGGDVILAACDDAYFFRFVPELVQSLAAAGVPALHLHLMEPSPDALAVLDELKAEFPRVALTHTIDRCSAASGLPYRNIYFNVARFVVAPLLLDRGAERLLVIDVDSVVHLSPWPMLETAEGAEAAFIFRHDARKPWHKVLAGAAFLGHDRDHRSPFAHMLARAVLRILQQKPTYHIDQIAAHYLTNILARTMAIREMPPGILSLESAEGAAIWTFKGPRKHSQPLASALLLS